MDIGSGTIMGEGVNSLIAVIAAAAALDFGARATASRGSRRAAWVTAAASVLGGFLWSMRMLTLLAAGNALSGAAMDASVVSLGAAMLVAFIGFAVRAGWPHCPLTALLGGAVIGLGLVVLHANILQVIAHPMPSFQLAMVAAASVAAVIAGALACRLHTSGRPSAVAAAALLLGAAIEGLHVLAAALAPVWPPPAPGAEPWHAGALGLPLAAGLVVILALAWAAMASDHRLAAMASAEAAGLREREAQWRRLYRDTPLPLHATDAAGRFTEVSDRWLELAGYTRDAVIGRPAHEFFDAESAKRLCAQAAEAVASDTPVRDCEARLRRGDGRWIEVLVSARIVLDEAGRGYRTMAGLTDVSALRRTELAFLEAQKMEAVAAISGGLAHDFNNMLGAVLGSLELAAARLETPSPATADLERARRSAMRAVALTQRLLAFSRRQEMAPASLNPDRLIASMADLMRQTLGRAIVLELHLAAESWRVQADAGQVENALLNLVINAKDAMPAGGRVVIETATLAASAVRELGIPELAGGDHIRLRVTDTGIGMSPEALAKACEPFFTTKPAGMGTGLGLAQVRGFARQAGGAIDIASRVGHGTCVTLYLPREMAPLPEAGSDLVAVSPAFT